MSAWVSSAFAGFLLLPKNKPVCRLFALNCPCACMYLEAYSTGGRRFFFNHERVSARRGRCRRAMQHEPILRLTFNLGIGFNQSSFNGKECECGYRSWYCTHSTSRNVNYFNLMDKNNETLADLFYSKHNILLTAHMFGLALR